MKRRKFFGAMAGIFGAPVAAKALSDASDMFPVAGELYDVPVTPKREMLDVDSFMPSNRMKYTAYSCVATAECNFFTAVSGVETLPWDFIPCSYCGRRGIHGDNCAGCGAQI